MGVPVVTLLGDRHSGRVGASIMHHVDLPELVADSVESYVQLAQSLANDQDHLLTIRSGLRQHMRESELMNKKLFTATLEKTYRQLWANWCDSVTE
jgi:predicted O-linked N-acetylglucosamine transferase (SPINDLY family)